MKYWIFIASLMVAIALSGPCSAGHIQIKCEPEIQIFLDGQYKGVSSADAGGLILQNIPPGTHRLRAVKSGFTPREETIKISGNEVRVWNIEQFVPRVKVSEEGEDVKGKIERQTGVLILQTLPVEAKIEIPSLGVSQSKQKDIWKVEDVPEGQYDVRVSGRGKSLSQRVKIEAKGTSRAFFNLITGKVEIQDIVKGTQSSTGAREKNRDNRFIAYDNETVLDTTTNLLWTAKDNGRDINWEDAKSYCANYRGGGYTDWRLPTMNELAALYDNSKGYLLNRKDLNQNYYKVKLTELIRLSDFCVWSGEMRSYNYIFFFLFDRGEKGWANPNDTSYRALLVRSNN